MKITKVVIFKFWIRRWRSISRRKAVWVAQNRGPYEAGNHAPLFRLWRCGCGDAVLRFKNFLLRCGSILAPIGSGAWIPDTKISHPFLRIVAVAERNWIFNLGFLGTLSRNSRISLGPDYCWHLLRPLHNELRCQWYLIPRDNNSNNPKITCL